MGFDSRRKLAEALNVSPRTIESWEQGLNPIPGWLRIALWGASITSRFRGGYSAGTIYSLTELPFKLGLTHDTISEAVSLGTLSVRSIFAEFEVDYDSLINFYIFFMQSYEGRMLTAIDRLSLIAEPDAAEDFPNNYQTYHILISLAYTLPGILGSFPPELLQKVSQSINNHIFKATFLLERISPEVLLGFSGADQGKIIDNATKRLAASLARRMLLVFSEGEEVEAEQERVVQSTLQKINVETVFKTIRRLPPPLHNILQVLEAFSNPSPGAMSPFTYLFARQDIANLLHYNVLLAMWNEKEALISMKNLWRVESLASQRLAARLAERLSKFLEKKEA